MDMAVCQALKVKQALLGQLAVELLVSRVRNKELTVEALNVQPELVVRNSVAPPRPR